jgi:Trk-type K+ transport system membrane component
MKKIDWKNLSPFKKIVVFYVILFALTLLLSGFFYVINNTSPFLRDATLVMAGSIVGSLIYDVFKATFGSISD